MPYIGHEPTNAGNFYILDDFNGLGQDGSSNTYDQNANGTIVNFKLKVAGVEITPNIDNLFVTIDGVVQHPTDAYTISGSILTFDEGPASGVDFHCFIMGQSASVGEGSIGADELKVSGDGTNNQLLKSDGDGTMSWINQNTVTASTANVATHVTVADNESTNENNLLTFVEDASGAGNVGLESDGDLHYNPSTGRLTATQLAGTLQTAAQGNITSVGTLSSLTLGGDLTLPQKIVHSGDTDTYLSFGTDSLSLYTGGTNVADFIYGNIYIKGNNKALVGYTTGASAKELIKINASDNLQIGEAGGGDVKITERLTVGSWDNSNTHGHAYIDISSDANEGADSCLYFNAGTAIKGSIYYNHNATAASQQMYFVTGDNSTNSLILDNSSATFAGAIDCNATGNQANDFAGGVYYSGTDTRIKYNSSNSVANSVLDVYNSSASGYGVYIQAGTGSNYSLVVKDKDNTENFKVLGNGLVQCLRGFTNGQALDIEGETFGRTNSSNVAFGYRQDGDGQLMKIQKSTSDVFIMTNSGRIAQNIDEASAYAATFENTNSGGYGIRVYGGASSADECLELNNHSGTNIYKVQSNGEIWTQHAQVMDSTPQIRGRKAVALNTSSTYKDIFTLEGGYQAGIIIMMVYAGGNAASTRTRIFAYNCDYYDRTITSLADMSGASGPGQVDVRIIKSGGDETTDGGDPYILQARPNDGSSSLGVVVQVLSAGFN